MDEKKFIMDEVTNHRNYRVIACNPSELPAGMQRKHFASVMLFGAVTSDITDTATRASYFI